MMTRAMMLAGLLAAAALPAAAQGPEPPSRAKVYASPQAVFDAYWAAQRKRDHKTSLDCLTPKALEGSAIDMALELVRQRDGGFWPAPKDGKGKVDERMKPVLEVMGRYGLTEKATRDIPHTPFGRGAKPAREKVKALIKKPEAFLLSVLRALEKTRSGRKPPAEEVTRKLEDLKVDGDRATGTVVHTVQEKDRGRKTEFRQPVGFARINGGWRLIPDRRFDEPREKDRDGLKDKDK